MTLEVLEIIRLEGDPEPYLRVKAKRPELSVVEIVTYDVFINPSNIERISVGGSVRGLVGQSALTLFTRDSVYVLIANATVITSYLKWLFAAWKSK